MSAQLTVVAVCLTADRPDMTRQAVASFRAQTYPAKRMLIYDTGRKCVPELDSEDDDVYWVPAVTIGDGKPTIGMLRNSANSFWNAFPIICHWDSDDWSHPNRIAEQVSLLQSSGAECVGYNEMLFWRETPQVIKDQYAEVQRRYPTDLNVPIPQHLRLRDGEAWLYTNSYATKALGTSLCYWRKTWEWAPFAALNSGEDTEWFNRVKVKAIRSFCQGCCNPNPAPHEPRMVARMHTGNAGNPAYWPAEMAKAPHHWRRVPEWDGYCRGVFAK